MSIRAIRTVMTVLGIASLVGVAASCGGDDDDVGATPTTSGELGEATSAIEVTVPAPPRYVRAADGNVHLEYDLVVTNVMFAPVSLASLVVKDGDEELARLEADALEAVTIPFNGSTPTLDIAASAAVTSLVDVMLPTDTYDDVPEHVTNELTYTIADDAPFRTVIRTLTVTSPPLEVPRFEPVVIEPPLRGGGWVPFNGCCTRSAHRSFLLSTDGVLHSVETFAIDWVLFIDGAPFQGDGSQHSDWYGYGETVYSATDGVVVHSRDDLPDAPLNDSGGGNDTVKAPDDYGGNGVVVKIDDDRYALYAHIQQGSVIPQVGDEISAGDPIGELGSTGNSSAPHLHFGIQETADAFGSNSVPYVIDEYTVTGTAAFSADGELTVTEQNSPQEQTFPLMNYIVDFGE